MSDYGQELRFGVFITPAADRPGEVVALAQVADAAALDFVTFQDHPYQAAHLDALTLLAFVLAQTTTVRAALNVANLPLRPPVVLARAMATLDLLSDGRVELGLGSGAFWDGIAAAGGRRLTPGQGVSALAEAIGVIRDVWGASGGRVSRRGEYYEVDGLHAGPVPAHPIEIWLGAYKPRMLALTGREADGWLPSMGYAEPDALAAMNEAIDAGATKAGRDPRAIRRMYNVNGRFGTGPGFLQGSPQQWAEQLAELTMAAGMSTYILAADDAGTITRFAEEVAPAVRELVDAGRAAGPVVDRDDTVAGEAEAAAGAVAWAVEPTVDDGERVSGGPAFSDEDSRPSGPAPDPKRRYTAEQQAAGRHLIDVHDALRAELDQLRDLVGQVERGQADAAAVRQHLNRMTIRQNSWTLGTFCAAYCRTVDAHHTLEDRGIFPHLRKQDAALAPVLDRLGAEHEVIAELVEQVDRAFVALVAEDDDGMEQVRAVVDRLTDALRSHLSYEERELVEPLARYGYYEG